MRVACYGSMRMRRAGSGRGFAGPNYSPEPDVPRVGVVELLLTVCRPVDVSHGESVGKFEVDWPIALRDLFCEK